MFYVDDDGDDYIVLFYLPHYAASDDVPTRTDISATALSKTSTADANAWSASGRVLLTGREWKCGFEETTRRC